MEDCNMKKEYLKPTMMVVKLHHHHHILVGSPGAKSFGDSAEEFIWDGDGRTGDDV